MADPTNPSLSGVPLVLPESRSRTVLTVKGSKFFNGLWQEPLFCANCGKLCGRIPEGMTHAFYLCNPCAEKFGQVAGLMAVPDEIVAHRLMELEREHYHRTLTPEDVAKELDDVNSPLSRLKREHQPG